MNAKLCKRLRREARAASAGRQARGYVPVFARKPNKDGTVTVIAFANSLGTTRGMYRALKKQARAAA